MLCKETCVLGNGQMLLSCWDCTGTGPWSLHLLDIWEKNTLVSTISYLSFIQYAEIVITIGHMKPNKSTEDEQCILSCTCFTVFLVLQYSIPSTVCIVFQCFMTIKKYTSCIHNSVRVREGYGVSHKKTHYAEIMKYKNVTWTLWIRTQSGEITVSFPQHCFDANIWHVLMTICKKFEAKYCSTRYTG